MIKSIDLEYAILKVTPQEAVTMLKKLDKGETSGRALGFACRFRGLEHVKALVEAGACFNPIRRTKKSLSYGLLLLDKNERFALSHEFSSPHAAEYHEIFFDGYHANNDDSVITDGLKAIPVEQRAEILKYLCDNRERVCLDLDELLFFSIMNNNKELTAVLKENGAAFSQERITALTEGSRGVMWHDFTKLFFWIRKEDILDVMKNLRNEVGGKKLHFTDKIYQTFYYPFLERFLLYKPEFFAPILETFDSVKMKKTMMMKEIIDINRVEFLGVCAQQGWLRMPLRRDEMIGYASEKNKTECVAWLLDYKNRTADLARECANAEKRAARELYAEPRPGSVTAFSKIWSFRPQEDGTLVITGYKGTDTDITVPAMM